LEHVSQFKNLILDPVLEEAGLYSPEASDLLLGTALVESNLKYFKQLGGGPALGYFQMEPATFNDIYDRYLSYHHKLKQIVEKFMVTSLSVFPVSPELIPIPLKTTQPFIQMMTNLPFAIVMARIKYLMIPRPIPKSSEGQGGYWKTYYNTFQGKGTVDKYLRKWKEWEAYNSQ